MSRALRTRKMIALMLDRWPPRNFTSFAADAVAPERIIEEIVIGPVQLFHCTRAIPNLPGRREVAATL